MLYYKDLLSKILTSSLLLTVASAIEKVGAFVGIVLLTKFLPTEEFGYFGMTLVYGQIFSILLYAGVQSISFKCITSTENSSKQLATYWHVVAKLWRRSAVVLLLLALLLLAFPKIEQIIGISSTVLILVAAIQCISVPQNIQNAIWVAKRDSTAIIVFSSCKTLLILLSCILIYFFPSVFLRFVSELVTVFFLNAILVFGQVQKTNPKIRALSKKAATEVTSMASYGYATIITQISYVAINGIDRLMLGFINGPDEVAIYVVFAQSIVVIFVVNSFNSAFSSEYFRNFSCGNKAGLAFNLSLKIYLLGSATLICYKIFLMKFGEAIVNILASEQYSLSGEVFHYGADIVFCYFTYIIFSRQLHANNDAKSLGSSMILAGAINLLLNLLLINSYGVLGAIYASLSSYFFLACYAYVKSRLSNSKFKSRYGDAFFATPFILFIGASVLF